MKTAPFPFCLFFIVLLSSNSDAQDQQVYGNLWLNNFRSTIFTQGDGLPAHRSGIQFISFDNGNTMIFQPTNQVGNPVNSTIRFGGFGAFNTNVVDFAITGKVGIGTTNSDFPLTVNGKIKCEEIQVVVDVADYVFDENYTLLKLDEVETFIRENKHLPGVPGKKEVDANGYEVGLMSNKLLEKIEELTLYIIKQEKRIAELEARMKK